MKDHSFGPFGLSIWMIVPKLIFFSSLMIGFSSRSFALDIWSFPNENELKTLVVTNLKSQPKDLWLSGPNVQDEAYFQIPALGRLEIPLIDLKQHAWMKAVSLDNSALNLELQTSANSLIYLSPQQTSSWKVRIRANSELILFNQAPFPQTLRLWISGQIWKEIQFQAFGKTRIPTASLTGQVVSIEGSARNAGLLWAGENSVELTPNAKPLEALQPAPEKRYFRLTDQDGSQSYTIALTDANLIAQAEKQIQSPWSTTYLPRILIGRVGFGHGGFNRDFSSKWKAPWSWHVSEVLRFADFASQACDGNPEALEQSLLSVSPDEQGVICFWDYRISEEVSLDRIRTGK